MTSTDLPLTLDELRRRIRAALRKNANAWASATMRHDLLMARAVRGMQREAVASWRRDVEPLVLRVTASELATFEERGHDARVPPGMLDRIVAEVARGTADVQRRVQGQLRAVVEAEQEWMQRTTERVLETPAPRPSAPQATATAEQRPFLGRRVDEWFRDYLQGPTGERVKQWVQTGVQRSLTNDEIVRGLRGTKASGYTDGILTGKPRHAVEALVRTAATHAATVTREGMLKQLGVKQVRFLATLDSRTSPQCRALDQQVFPIDEGPRPPLHPNCRSTVLPFLGEPTGQRASKDGPVDAQMDYADWLHRQDAATQDDVLGRTKATAWRAGKLTLQQMLGPDLEPLTVAQLRELDRL